MKSILLAILFAAAAFAVPCNVVDIQKAVDAAQPGDVLTVDAGSNRATTAIVMGKSLDLRIDPACVIVNDYTAGNLFTVTEPLVGELRISGGDFRTGLGPTPGIPYHFVKWLRQTGGTPIAWLNSKWDVGYGSNVFGVETNRGVISGNTFKGSLAGNICSNNASALRLKPRALGEVWLRPHLWGATDVQFDQSFYFETNDLTNVFEAIDIDDNGSSVVRKNIMRNSAFLHHGIDTGFDGARASEIYDNEFIWDPSVQCGIDQPAGTNSMVYVRGGTIKLFNNRIQDIRSPWWGDKSEVNFTTEELRRNAGRCPCTTQYPSFHQTGHGWITGGTTDKCVGQTQDIEPSYIWGNTGGGNYNSPSFPDYAPNQCGATAPLVADFIKLGREVILGPAPNYTPAPYPHPRANIPGPPGIPAAPTNLRVTSIQ